MKKALLALATVGVLVGLVATGAEAHRTHNDRRTPAECRALQDPAKREACLSCIARPRPHHFHPGVAPGDRCRPNDGERQ